MTIIKEKEKKKRKKKKTPILQNLMDPNFMYNNIICILIK